MAYLVPWNEEAKEYIPRLWFSLEDEPDIWKRLKAVEKAAAEFWSIGTIRGALPDEAKGEIERRRQRRQNSANVIGKYYSDQRKNGLTPKQARKKTERKFSRLFKHRTIIAGIPSEAKNQYAAELGKKRNKITFHY